MARKSFLISFLIVVFVLSGSVPRFGVVSHEHAGGQQSHVHPYLSLSNSSLQGHHHLKPLQGYHAAGKAPVAISRASASSFHWHQVDDSLGSYIAYLVLLPLWVTAVFLQTLPYPPQTSRHLFSTHARAPPLPLAV